MADLVNDIPCGYVCTHAITGSIHPAHQAIYICETCRLLPNREPTSNSHISGEGEQHCNDEDDNINADREAFCICECCAEVCHADHIVEFVGVGPCTCDCYRLCCPDECANTGESSAEISSGKTITRDVCKLVEISKEEANRLGFSHVGGKRSLNDPIPLKIPTTCTLLSNVDDTDDILNASKDSSNAPSGNDIDSELVGWINPQCIQCNSSMGGYTLDSFTIPSLSSSDGVQHCQNLVRQAEALVDESRETFWVPVGDDELEISGKDEDLSDLELLAKAVYLQHVKSYNLNMRTFTEKKDVNADLLPRLLTKNNSCTDEESKPGAEWWVQVKPEGSTKTPVDLHYDKDEALAEAFCLGSFPTLSTVTYLTGSGSNQQTFKDGGCQGGMDEAPTVVFPHTYHDDEDQPIHAMLLSRPVRGKHIVFDGRLLHGAPGHPGLRPAYNNGAEDKLRVTFLVNIWRTGRPAGVHVLPKSIRSKLQTVRYEGYLRDGSLPYASLEFERRYVPQYNAPSKLSLAFSADNPLDTHFTLPFVSKGATWISESDDEQEEGRSGDKLFGSSGLKRENDEQFDDDDRSVDDGQSEEEDELFLRLPQFVSPEYSNNHVDTAMFLFESGNEARLVRRSAQNDYVEDV